MLQQKQKKLNPSKKDCTNCGTSGASLTCAACKASHYCSKACQKQDWKNGHKTLCIAPEKRRPQTTTSMPPMPSHEKEREKYACPICLELILDQALCKLPCEHEFHQACVEELRKRGVLQACPLCRTALPNGAEKLFDDAARMFVGVFRTVESRGASWQTLNVSQRNIMAEVMVMLTTAANQGNANAQLALAEIYSHGFGVAQDQKKGLHWTRQAADHGNPDAQFKLGVMYDKTQDYENASRWYQKAADQGYADAQHNLAGLYHRGQGVPRDIRISARWTQKAAQQGHASAQYNIGVMYRDGQGVAQNHNEAAHWIRKAADQGYIVAQINFALMYLYGRGVAQNYKEAVRWAQKAADKGNANAQNLLAGCYREGQGVARDPKRAVQWYQKAAVQGDDIAQSNLAVMYRDGLGVAQNFKEALRWFRKAADQGFVEAQNHLAGMYLCGQGQGGAQDQIEGLRWAQKAAEQGHADAQFNLAGMYRNGHGVAQDRSEAARWLRKAAAQGHPGAVALMSDIGTLSIARPVAPVSPDSDVASSHQQCASCGRGCEDGLKLRPCSRCKLVVYCGEDCQRVHWKGGHRAKCSSKK